MAMSVSPGSKSRPDSAITAARESARRKNKSFAQYTGVWRPGDPTDWGWNRLFSPPPKRMQHPQGMRLDLLLQSYLNTANLAGSRPRRSLRQGVDFQRESRKTRLFGRERLQ